jgi:hypothetical protein
MKRTALLIEASQVAGLSDLPGARKDIEDWGYFLKSPLGGAWEKDEIMVLNTPTKSLLEVYLSIVRKNDYVFIAFSGHGYHAKAKNIDETRICLAGKEELSVNFLNCGAPKITIVVDACREVHYLKEDLSAVFAMDELSKRMLCADKEKYRKLYDEQIEQAPTGAEYLYSCNLNESAGESSQGGYFTQALLRCGEKFDKNNSVYTVHDAFWCAYVRLSNKASQQNPVFEGGRRLTHYPFAVFV